MAAILTAAEMRALEQEAIARGEVTGLELMERAGRGVVEAILAEWPDIEGGAKRAVVLCGPGNNGGDGFVVARLLRERGWDVEVFLYGDAGTLPPDARTNHERWCGIGGVHPLGDTLRPSERNSDLIVDALFGTGLTRPISGLEFVLFDVMDVVDGHPGSPLPKSVSRYPKVVSVDIPSGLCADSGTVLFPVEAGEVPKGSLRSWVVRADLTVTFHSQKLGHVIGDGPDFCGKLRTVDIGLPGHLPKSMTYAEVAQAVRPTFLGKDRTGHKYTHGHALLVSGRPGRGGAARLAARGALRVGAGLVTLAVPPGALQENAARLDAIMLRSVKDAEALTDLLSDPRFNALAAGPGLGTSDREAALLGALLDASRPGATPPEGGQGASDQGAQDKGRALVLDADALTLVAKRPDLRAGLHAACVLTPHDGEFARLFPTIADRLNAPATAGPAYSKVDAARDAAREVGCTVLLKGPDTVIADPSGRVAVNAAVYDRAAPWLATAGSGDVLTGFIVGLLARGFAPFEAACTGAWLHVEAARSFGPGLIAEDLPEELPKVLRALGL